MPTLLTNYHPDKVILSFKGINITGYAEGTFIEVERAEDAFMEYVGSLGEVCRTRNLNRLGTVTLTLMATSAVNDALTAIAVQDEDGSIIETGALQLKDGNGNMKCDAPEAWIKKMPKVERAKESGTVQWVITCASLTIKPGGNVV